MGGKKQPDALNTRLVPGTGTRVISAYRVGDEYLELKVIFYVGKVLFAESSMRRSQRSREVAKGQEERSGRSATSTASNKVNIYYIQRPGAGWHPQQTLSIRTVFFVEKNTFFHLLRSGKFFT